MNRFFSLVAAPATLFAGFVAAGSALAAHPILLPQPLKSPDILVEGYVFDHVTGRPMRNVEVVAMPWLFLASTGPFNPVPLVSLDDAVVERPGDLVLPPPPGFAPLPGPSVYSDENGFYSMVVRADRFRTVRATCHTARTEAQPAVPSSTSGLPLYDLRETRRDLYLKTGTRRGYRPECHRIYTLSPAPATD